MSILNKVTSGKKGRAQKAVIYAEIAVGRNHVAIVSPEDFARISGFRWHLTDKGYAATNVPVGDGSFRYVKMHREIVSTGGGFYVDHINGDRLDNRRENLRVATHSENARNAKRRKDSTTGFKGVTPRPDGKFQARITYGGKRYSLGYFQTKEEAATAYAKAALEHHREFARLN